MERMPELKMIPGWLPSINRGAGPRISAPRTHTARSQSRQSSEELGFSVRVRKGKYSVQDREELMEDTAPSKLGSDSFEDDASISFRGASHPPEPIHKHSSNPAYMPIGKNNPQSPKATFLDDSGPFMAPRASQNTEASLPLDSEKECVWDTSLPPSPDASPYSSIGSTSVIGTMSIDNSYRSEFATPSSDGMISFDRNYYENTKLSVRGDSLESDRTSNSSGFSDDSTWSNLTGSGNKPHKGNDLRWKAILAIRARDGMLGMSHFRLLKRLGCGDVGSVYLSELSGTRCFFAMKVMDKASLAARRKLNRAQTEREILELLDHPFLPTLYTHIETDRFSCLVMEYCPGGDLHTLRQQQPGKHFSEYAARIYAAEVLLALEYLHMLGIIYRDLKPENVLVREDGHIMLSDFDLSLRCTSSPTLIKSSDSGSGNAFCAQPTGIEPTSVCVKPSWFFLSKNKKKNKHQALRTEPGFQAGRPLPELCAEPIQARSMSFVGTHEYLAPEIIKGEGHGSAVDWWTFGIFLHELLYGKTPFKGSGNRATLFNVVGQQLKFPEWPCTSYAGRDLIRGLLVKEPQNRLGVKRGATEIRQHPFFEGVNWALIRCSTPPEIPRPVEVEFPRKLGVVDPVGVGSGSRRTEVKAGGGMFLDFEFF